MAVVLPKDATQEAAPALPEVRHCLAHMKVCCRDVVSTQQHRAAFCLWGGRSATSAWLSLSDLAVAAIICLYAAVALFQVVLHARVLILPISGQIFMHTAPKAPK